MKIQRYEKLFTEASKNIKVNKDSLDRFIKLNLSDKDYEDIHLYNRLDECIEVIKLKGHSSVFPIEYKGEYLFVENNNIIPFYRALKVGDKFLLQEMTYASYNRLGF